MRGDELLRALWHGADPSGEAVEVADERCSYAELRARALALADVVQSPPHSHSKVLLHATASLDTVVGVVAGIIAGVPVVTVPADSGAAELQYVIQDSGASAWLGAAPSHGAGGLPVLAGTVAPRGRRDRLPVPDQPGPALILYTSGTTGSPKAVPINSEAIAACLDGLAQAWQWTSADTLVHGLPLFHVHGLVLGVLGPLRIGSGLVHTGRPTAAAYASASGTMYFGVPTVWSRIAEHPEEARALASARLLVSGSAALPFPVINRLRELTGQQVVQRYGMTETLITLAARAGGVDPANSVGVPIAGVQTRLRGAEGGEIPHDGQTLGRLQVRGSTVFAGYLNRPEATAESFTEDGWFATGDIATVDAAGVHQILGREAEDVIKTGGYRVGAGEIESCLLGHHAVAECAVIGVPDEDLGERIVAYVVRDDDSSTTAEPLIDYVAASLSAHKRPREIRFVPDLPRNPMGKVQKSRLTEP